MKVLAIGNFRRHAYADHWRGIREGFKPLESEGVVLRTLDFREIVGADPFDGYYPPDNDRLVAELIRKERPDVVLFGIQDAMTDTVLDAAKDDGAYTALWFCDLRDPGARDLRVSLNFLALTNAGQADAYAAAWGLMRENIIWLPQGTLRRTTIASFDPVLASDILFVGSWGHPEFHDMRRDVFENVEKEFGMVRLAGLPDGPPPPGLVAYCPTIDDQKAQVTRRLAGLYASAKVSIGVSEPVAGYHSNRLCMATGYGACYFCNWFPGIESLFEPGKEVETFYPFDSESYIPRLKWLVSDDQAARRHRDEIRWNAFRRAQDEHTYEKRIRILWDAIRSRM